MNKDNKSTLDTMLLYSMDKSKHVPIRVSIHLKDLVNGEVLNKATNEAINRYPYFRRKLDINDLDEYVLLESNEPVVVTRTSPKGPILGSKETNGYLISVDYDDYSINFNISHSLTNGPGVLEWALTTVYQYVTEKENVKLDCPSIRKVDSPFLKDECTTITSDLLPKDNVPLWKGYKEKKIKTYTLLKGYIRCILQPGSVDNYYSISIDEKELMQYIKDHDGSPATFFSVIMFKAANKWLPKKYKDVEIGNYVCCARQLGIPNSYMDSSMPFSTRYKRKTVNLSTEKLCTMTRGNTFLQTDESVIIEYWKNKLATLEKMKEAKGLKAKKKIYMTYGNPHTRAILPVTGSISYIGRYDLGELSPFIKNVSVLVDGEGIMEILALNNKFNITFMQKDKKERWFKSFLSALDDENIKYTVEGPFNKNLSKGILPK